MFQSILELLNIEGLNGPGRYGLAILIGTLIGLLLRWLIIQVLRRSRMAKDGNLMDQSLKHFNKSFLLLLPAFFSLALLLGIKEENQIWGAQKAVEILLVIGICWVLMKALNLFEDVVLGKYDLSKQDNYRERKIYTQLKFIKSTGKVVIVILGLAAILMEFESLRQFGTGLLASAGVAGIIIGFAAQRSIANLLAGLQIAFTQPIKIDDAVFVENEWGRIEEINLTYVVIKIWDWRRLVLPITYFIEKPFQNWTRKEANLLGSVFLFVDYRLPVNELRQELKRILSEEPLHDGVASVLQVVETTERNMQLRALMSAKTAPEAWDLRCIVRERLIDFIAERYPNYLPNARITLNEKEAFEGVYASNGHATD